MTARWATVQSVDDSAVRDGSDECKVGCWWREGRGLGEQLS